MQCNITYVIQNLFFNVEILGGESNNEFKVVQVRIFVHVSLCIGSTRGLSENDVGIQFKRRASSDKSLFIHIFIW